jgi:cell division protease FtsH
MDNKNKLIPPRKDKPGDPEAKPPGRYNWVFYFILLNIIIAYFILGKGPSGYEVTWPEFRNNMLVKGDVERIDIVNKEIAEVYIKPDSLKKPKYVGDTRIKKLQQPGPQYSFKIGSIEVLERRLDEAQANVPESGRVVVKYVEKQNLWAGVLAWVFPIAMIFLFLYYMRRAGKGGMGQGSVFDFGKTRDSEYNKAKISPVTFNDIAGYDEAKTEVMEVVSFLKKPESYTKLGAKIPKGILLVGPPGSGKTLLARAVAGEAAVPFFSLSGSEFVEIFVGVGASRVRDLFNKAKQKAPSIIFIDEIDTVGRTRGKSLSAQANDERESTLNQLLTEMDGFDANTGVIVMAATNRADVLDPALLRAGRFDRHIYLELPNKKEREAIFKVHLKPLKLDQTVDSDYLASQTPGFSGADIANVCNEAALIAARGKKEAVGKQDFFDAIDRVVAGLEQKSKIITQDEKKIIAYHEAGHAIVSWTLKNVDPLVKVSIIPRGRSLGSAWYLPEEHQITTLSQFSDRLCATLGGRVAEEIVFNEPSSGALDDLEKATKQAYMMVTVLGLNKEIGAISYYDSTGTYESFQKPYSEATGQLIDREVHKLLLEAYKRTERILMEKRTELDNFAQLLLEKEVIYKEDIEKLLGLRAT